MVRIGVGLNADHGVNSLIKKARVRSILDADSHLGQPEFKMHDAKLYRKGFESRSSQVI